MTVPPFPCLSGGGSFVALGPRSPPVKHTSCRLCPLAVTWSSRRKQPIRKILDQLRGKLIKFSQVCLTYSTEPWDSYTRIKACACALIIQPPSTNPPPQVQMIYGHHDMLVEGVVFLTADVQTRVVCATGSFDITENMKTWNIVIDHWARANQIAPWFVWS